MKHNVHLIARLHAPLRAQRTVLELLKLEDINVNIHWFHVNPTLSSSQNRLHQHLSMYQYAQEQGMEWIWISEDSIQTRRPLPPMDFLQDPQWGLVFLGGSIDRPWDYCVRTKYPHVYETRNANHGTMSYIIHRRLYSLLLEKKISEPLEVALSRYTNYIYGPMIFHPIEEGIWTNPSLLNVSERIFFNKRYLNVLLILILICVIIIGIIFS